MGVYAYPIRVDYERREVTETHEKLVAGLLTVDKLQALVGSVPF